MRGATPCLKTESNTEVKMERTHIRMWIVSTKNLETRIFVEGMPWLDFGGQDYSTPSEAARGHAEYVRRLRADHARDHAARAWKAGSLSYSEAFHKGLWPAVL